MKLGIILETKEPEKVWNALRFATTARKQEHDVKFFLMGEAVEIESVENEKFNVKQQLQNFVNADGEVLACGTCLETRKMGASNVCPISTMIDCVEMVEWADKTVTF